MSPRSFWLGDREHIPNDFDGELRRGDIVRRLLVVDDDGKPFDDRYLWVRVDPPFPLKDGARVPEVAMLEAGGHTDLAGLETEPYRQDSWWTVYIAQVVDRSRIGDGVVPLRGLIVQGSGQIALRADLLPSLLRERFEQGFVVLRQFVEREGHAVVPSDHVENGFPLGLWVTNIRILAAHGMPAELTRQLEALPGWTWS